ncbi:MAG: (deoxy)nucleoside triphosphate pyrophosphohydrolase [Myxococcota bacterium]
MRVVAAAWLRDGQVLAAQHGPGSDRAGEWEFPGGKVEPGETDHDALRRELREELDVDVDVRGEAMARVRRPLGERTLDLWLYEVRSEAEPRALEHQALAWVDPEAGDELRWSAADAELWRTVRDRLGR